MVGRLVFLLLGILLIGTPAVQAMTLDGRVVTVQDGDTIVVLSAEGRRYRVRLSEIDAPESSQPYGAEARRALAGMILRQHVHVRVTGTDRWGRLLGRVSRGKVDINGAMVVRGAAWANLPYLTDQRFLLWEREARAAGRGLWALPAQQRVPPWEKRRGTANNKNAAPAPQRAGPVTPVPPAAMRCGSKRRCAEMVSCAEATFHLKQCGLTSLDRNGDGVPCETLCRR